MYQLWSPSISAASTARQLGQHVVADVAVEEVAAGEAALVLGGVELRHRVDHVELRLRAERSSILTVVSPRSAPISTTRRAPAASRIGAITMSQSGYIDGSSEPAPAARSATRPPRELVQLDVVRVVLGDPLAKPGPELAVCARGSWRSESARDHPKRCGELAAEGLEVLLQPDYVDAGQALLGARSRRSPGEVTRVSAPSFISAGSQREHLRHVVVDQPVEAEPVVVDLLERELGVRGRPAAMVTQVGDVRSSGSRRTVNVVKPPPSSSVVQSGKCPVTTWISSPRAAQTASR